MVGASATSGLPPPNENRPITGTRPGLKTAAFESRAPCAVALEITADADAFGMIAAETGMDSVVPFKLVDEPRGRQRLWAEPAAQIEKSCHNAQNHNSNAHQSWQRAASAQGRWLFFRGRGRVTRQLFAPMPLQANLFLEPHIDFQPTDNVHPRPIDAQYSPAFQSGRMQVAHPQRRSRRCFIPRLAPFANTAKDAAPASCIEDVANSSVVLSARALMSMVENTKAKGAPPARRRYLEQALYLLAHGGAVQVPDFATGQEAASFRLF